MRLCFWCGMRGPSPRGFDQASTRSERAYAACESCQEAMHEGAVFVEVILDPDRVIGQVPLLLSPKRTVYPTGLWCVVPEELARSMSVEVEWGFAFVEPAAWDTLGLPRPEIATC